jgi:hypothetical protein
MYGKPTLLSKMEKIPTTSGSVSYAVDMPTARTPVSL